MGADREHGVRRGDAGGFGQASYSTTKAGLLGLTKALAMEGGRHGITCNAIVPGIIGTEAFHMANPVMNERIANRTVFKRPGEPQDIANAIAFLCSDLAAYVTGIELNVSGGVKLSSSERPDRGVALPRSSYRGDASGRLHFRSCHPARPASRVWRADDALAASRCAGPSSRSASSCCSRSPPSRSSRDRRRGCPRGRASAG